MNTLSSCCDLRTVSHTVRVQCGLFFCATEGHSCGHVSPILFSHSDCREITCKEWPLTHYFLSAIPPHILQDQWHLVLKGYT